MATGWRDEDVCRSRSSSPDEFSAQDRLEEALRTSVLLTVKTTVVGKDRDQLWTGQHKSRKHGAQPSSVGNQPIGE